MDFSRSGRSLADDEKHAVHHDDSISEFDPVKYKALANPSQHFESDVLREDYSPFRALAVAPAVAGAPSGMPAAAAAGKNQGFSSSGVFQQAPKVHEFQIGASGVVDSIAAHEIASHFSKRLQLSDNPPPRPMGNYLEPHHHFFSSKAPQELLTYLQHALFQLDVDFSAADRQDYQLKCAAYDVAAEIPFVCSVFTAPSGDIPYVVEIQRRNGDVFKFSKIYRSIVDHMVQAQVIDTSSVPPSRRLLTPPPLSDPVDMDAAQEAIQILVNMGAADYVDVKLEGLYALAQLTLEADMRSTVVNLALPLFIDCLSNAYESVHRAALTSLANLTDANAECCTSLRDKGAISLVLQLTASATPQVVREAFRVLSNIAAALGKSLNDPQVAAIASHFLHHRDARTRTAADRICRALKV